MRGGARAGAGRRRSLPDGATCKSLKLTDDELIFVKKIVASCRTLINLDKEILSLIEKREQKPAGKPVTKPVTTDFNEDQKRAFEKLMTNQNVFLTGGAGVGKTFLLNKYLSSKQNVIRLAPTGKAAQNFGGMTIHRFFKAPIGIITEFAPPPDNKKEAKGWLRSKLGQDNYKALQAAKILSIDEISMVRSDLFEYVLSFHKLAEFAFDHKIQLVLCGDFAQLPPVAPSPSADAESKKSEYQVWQASQNGENLEGWAFATPAWKNAKIEKIILNQTVRQAETDFATALNRIRIGDSSGLDWVMENCKKGVPNGDYIALTATNKASLQINSQQLRKLQKPVKLYKISVPEYTESGMLNQARRADWQSVCEEDLCLCSGARVMLTANDAGGKFHNGSTGAVVWLTDDKIKIRLDDGEVVDVTRKKYAIYGYRTTEKEKEKKVERYIIGQFEQFPIRLGWALTVHKSQGATLSTPVFLPDADQFFAPGQAYVALSRATEVGLLHLHERPKLVTSDAVRAFYSGGSKGILRSSQDQMSLFSS